VTGNPRARGIEVCLDYSALATIAQPGARQPELPRRYRAVAQPQPLNPMLAPMPFPANTTGHAA
jgi:hypothetical protein